MIVEYDDIKNKEITSKLLNEYIKAKEENKNSIVLFQVGSFYESYFNDAKILSEITGILLTKKYFKNLGSINQAGIPINNIKIYIKKLLQNNCDITIYKQLKDNNDNYYREKIRTYTKGTIYETEYLDSFENNYLLGIKKEDNIYNISYCDLSTGEFYKTKGNKEEITNEIKKIEPSEVIILNNQKDLFDELIEKYKVTFVENNKFKNELIENILIEYYKKNQKNSSPLLNEIKSYNINSYMQIDDVTRRTLELTRTRRTMKKNGSLIYFLNHTKTPMGMRLLKKYINEPLLDIEKIKTRQEAIDEIINNKKLYEDLQEALSNFCDLSRICAKISNSSITPKNLLAISSNKDSIENLYSINKKIKSEILKIDEKILLKSKDIINEIKNAIDENCDDDIKSGNIIKSGYNSNLDYIKNNIDNYLKSIKEYETKEKSSLEINKLTINYSKVLGYYIEIPNSESLKLSEKYFKIQSTQNKTRYKTEKLKELEDKYILEIHKQNELEFVLFNELRKKLVAFTQTLRELSTQIAKIDVCLSFATCAIKNNFKKPSFNSEKIKIEQGYHPLIIENDKIIKNDTLLNNESIIILTGANMSGKSTYLKHNAIICLLAQIGSFVPTESADVTILDRIFFHQNSIDDISNNISNFMSEMQDFKFIIENSTKDSLILLDEPAKSTNQKEGTAITKAFLEYIIKNIKAKTIVATHNIELTSLKKIYEKQIENYFIQDKNSLDYRKIKQGISEHSNAIEVAKDANLPLELIKKATYYYSN